MPLLDIAAISGRAAWVRARAGLADVGPPYSTHTLIDAVPGIAVAGADLPRGVHEMAERGAGGRRTLWYAHGLPHGVQRVALAHGLHHHLTDLRRAPGMRECNAAARELERSGALGANPSELASDLFAGELLTPFAVLDVAAPAILYPRGVAEQAAWRDQVEALASLFKVPSPFMRWRLWDLMHLRRTNFYVA